MKPLMLITGPVATRSGYGSHTRDLVRSLISMDKFDIKINSLRWGNTPMNALDENNPNDLPILQRILKSNELPKQPEIHIQVSVPNEFTPIAKYNIGVTAGIENTAPKAEWVQGLNRMNMNIVPSKFVKEIFQKVSYEEINEQTKQKTGELRVTSPIEVLFEGADVLLKFSSNLTRFSFRDSPNPAYPFPISVRSVVAVSIVPSARVTKRVPNVLLILYAI